MAVELESYPRPRLARAGPTSAVFGDASADTTPVVATSHVIPFNLFATATNRTSRSSVLLKGPALVISWHFMKTGAAGGTMGITLGKSASAIVETNVARTIPLPFTSLLDAKLFGGNAVGLTEPTDDTVDFAASSPSHDSNLGIIILDAEFFLVVSVIAAGTGSLTFGGHVTVLSGVGPDVIANFR